MPQKKPVSGIGLAAIMSLYLVSMGITVVTPAMATFAKHWPGRNISFISTLPTLFIVLGTAISGSLVGKRISYRSLALLSSLISLIGGCAPALFDDFTLTLVFRGVMGLGLGLMAPLGNALILGLYQGQKQASLLGYGTLFMNAGGIAMQMLGGALAERGWQMTFWGHAFFIIALVLSLFLPEPENAQEHQTHSAHRERIGSSIFAIAFLIFLYNTMVYPVMLNMSTLFISRNAGGATAAATALSLYTVAGVAAGFIFGQIFRVAKRYVIAIGFLMAALGLLLVHSGESAVIMTIGLMIIGFGFSLFFPAFMAWAGIATPPSTVPMASSVILACMNLGGFVSSFWLSALTAIAGENVMSAIRCAIVMAAVLGVIFLVYSPFAEKRKAQ